MTSIFDLGNFIIPLPAKRYCQSCRQTVLRQGNDGDMCSVCQRKHDKAAQAAEDRAIWAQERKKALAAKERYKAQQGSKLADAIEAEHNRRMLQ